MVDEIRHEAIKPGIRQQMERAMTRYSGTAWSKAHAPYAVCLQCGWEGRDWGFKYRKLCKQCHAKWQKDKAKQHRETMGLSTNVQIADGILVTEHVERRLRRRAEREVGPTIVHLLAIVVPIVVFVGAVHLHDRLLNSGGDSPNEVLLATILLGTFLIPLGIACFLANMRDTLVTRKAVALAEIRKKNLDEQRSFYSSPEWRLLREQVIAEQGRCCQKCRRQIAEDFDLTVDHIKPRSKFPELALDKSNLQVLCRTCNSSKGQTCG